MLRRTIRCEFDFDRMNENGEPYIAPLVESLRYHSDPSNISSGEHRDKVRDLRRRKSESSLLVGLVPLSNRTKRRRATAVHGYSYSHPGGRTTSAPSLLIPPLKISSRPTGTTLASSNAYSDECTNTLRWFKKGPDYIDLLSNSPFELSIALGVAEEAGGLCALEKALDEFDEWEAKCLPPSRYSSLNLSSGLNPQDSSFAKRDSTPTTITRSPTSVARANGLLKTPMTKGEKSNITFPLLSEFLDLGHEEEEHFLIPRIKRFAIEMLERGAPLDASNLTSHDCRGFLANAFFGNVIDVLQDEKDESAVGGLNLLPLMRGEDECSVQKLLCFLHYFASDLPDDKVAFNLHTSPHSIECYEEMLRKCDLPISEIHLTADPLEVPDAALVDDSTMCKSFAYGNFNSTRIGDTMQMLCPELAVGMLYFSEIPHNSVVTARVRRLCERSGFGLSFTCLGPLYDPYTQLILTVGSPNRRPHDLRDAVADIRAAALAFKQAPDLISTKEWGSGCCAGVFVHSKFLIQVLAASIAGKPLRYSISNNEEVLDEFNEILGLIYRVQCTVKELFEVLPPSMPCQGWYAYLSSKLEKPDKVVRTTA